MKLKFSSPRSQILAKCPHTESVKPFAEYNQLDATILNLYWLYSAKLQNDVLNNTVIKISMYICTATTFVTLSFHSTSFKTEY